MDAVRLNGFVRRGVGLVRGLIIKQARRLVLPRVRGRSRSTAQHETTYQGADDQPAHSHASGAACASMRSGGSRYRSEGLGCIIFAFSNVASYTPG